MTCISCKKKKDVDEKMYILSLPVPEAEFNYFSIIVVPITSTVIKKIIFKIHNSATVVNLNVSRLTIFEHLKKELARTPMTLISARLMAIL